MISIPAENKNRIICVKDYLTAYATGSGSLNSIKKLKNWLLGKEEDLKKIELGFDLEWEIVNCVWCHS